MGCEVELTCRPLASRTSFSTAHKIAIDFEQPLHFAQNIPPIFVLRRNQNVAVTYVLN